MHPDPAPSTPDPEPADPEPPRVHRSRTARALYLSVGVLSLTLGVIGAFLPLLPTTVFVLIAAYCFARSSERFYTALLDNKHFGPTIRNWQAHRCISRQGRTYAIALIVLSFGVTTTGFVEGVLLRVVLVALAAALILYLARLPTCGDRS